MKLHEYQSKQIFSKYGIPIPKGRVAATADEVKQIAKELGSRVVIKSQVLVGGRGKAGRHPAGEEPGRSRRAGFADPGDGDQGSAGAQSAGG